MTQDNKKSVLHIVLKWSAKGGVTTFLRSFLAEGCLRGVNQQVLSLGEIEYENAPKELIGPLVESISPAQLIRAAYGLKDYLICHPVDVVHIHTNNSIGFVCAHSAKLAGIPVRIVHSHNSRLGDNGIGKHFVHYFLRKLYLHEATHYLACSKEAGEFLFDGHDYTVINNGVDIQLLRFNEDVRSKIRYQLGAEPDTRVVCQVGSFLPPKNTTRVIEIFAEYERQYQNVMLVLVGDGPDKNDAERFIDELQLKNKVVETGFTDRVADYLSASDVMLFPSLYEGLPFAVIEAQANGLPVIVSDSVSKDCAITDLVSFVSLEESNINWMECIDQQLMLNAFRERKTYAMKIKTAGFTIEQGFDTCCKYYGINKDSNA